MGICIQKCQQNLDIVCSKQPKFGIDQSKPNTKCMSVWRITPSSCDPLKWPYKFLSSSSYIVLIVNNSTNPSPVLQKQRTSLELAEMLFGAQFLILHMKSNKRIMLNNKQYQLTIYSFYGDSEEDQLLARTCLTYYMQKLIKYLQFGAGSLCISMLNQPQPICLKNDIKQFIQFESEQYQQANSHVFFKQILFRQTKSIKQNINQNTKLLFFNNFTHGSQKLPHIEIKQMQNKKQQKINKQKQLQQEMPFACQITQINIKGANKVAKVEAGNIDESNILFDQLGIDQNQQNDRIEQFIKGLYLSTEKTSKNFNLLNQHKIKLIINCAASTCKNWFINDINYKWLDMPDPAQNFKNQYNIQCLIYQVADLASKCLAEPSGVLIHCGNYNPKVEYSGSRSAAIMIGLIMSSLKIKYEQAYSMIKKKWEVKILEFMQKQLRQLQRRRKQKPKGFQVYSICSYSKNFPKHIVAKYICQVQNINNIQGIQDFAKSVFLCISVSAAKVMIGRQCEQKEQYQKYAKQYFRLISKYHEIKLQLVVEQIDKTFRKQPKIQVNDLILHQNTNKVNKNAGFMRNQQIVLKYPILRPVWQKKKQDGFYFTIREKNNGAEVVMSKGMNWIGYQQDKQQFFQRIISTFLSHIPDEKIFIMQSQQDRSLFDTSQINL